MEEAMSRAEESQGKAEHSLVQASQAAGNQHVGLSETGSYSDFLAAKQNAANAWAAVSGPDANPRSVRGALMTGRGQAATDGLSGREMELGARNSGNAGSHSAYQRGVDERAAATQAEQAARTQTAIDARNKHLTGAYSRWQAAMANGGGTEERDRYAQMMSNGIDQGWRLPGLTPEQQANAGQAGDRRGWGIEEQAWGRTAKPYGRPTTKKGTAY